MKNNLIIENPSLQSLSQRYGWFSVTFLFWLIYVYLWLPLLSLFAWWLGYKTFIHHMIELNGQVGFFNVLGFYLVVITSLTISLVGWARLELMRFRDKSQRLKPEPISVKDAADFYHLDVATLKLLQENRNVTIHFDENGNIKRFEVAD